MPFTAAHAAAALPFRRTRLVFSAVVVGSFAPDFEFFLRLAPRGGSWHTLRGAFLMALPAALVILWLYHRWAKYAAVALMPQPLRARMAVSLGDFRFGGPRRFALVVASTLVGIATHIAWDSFTHSGSWVVQHSPVLSRVVYVPPLGLTQVCRILQHTSTVVGLAILAVWIAHWYRRTPPLAERKAMLSSRRRTELRIALPVAATAGAILRVAGGLAFVHSWRHLVWMLVIAMITWIAVFWWLLVAAGYFLELAPQRVAQVGAAR